MPCLVKSRREVRLYHTVSSIDFVELEVILHRNVLFFSHLKKSCNSQFLGIRELFNEFGKRILSFGSFQVECSRKPICFSEVEAVLLAEFGALIDRFVEPESHKPNAFIG